MSRDTTTPHHDQMELLSIYLDDHWAGAAAGVNLANRMFRHNRNTTWAEDLAWLCEQIESDRRTLSELRKRLQMSGGQAKRRLAVVVERVSRLKLNGRIVRYSPLSQVLEAEALMSGVTGKQRLWAALHHGQPIAVDLSGFDFEDLERRAEQQIELLRTIHHEAAAVAFSTDLEGDL
ncbi:MAG TPA: hypothetical protein VF148_11920 [Acidimicrobiia bacterium]